ncbi:MAG: hypothetical protein PHD72_01555 [Patescibacteria group bacterium]|nr:hypothetical protein [Patescibacteria group bacterium]
MVNKRKSKFLDASIASGEMWKIIMEAVIAEGGGDEHILRIKEDPSLVERLAREIVGVDNNIIDALRVMCDYRVLTHAELKSAFDFVNDIYIQAEFKAIDVCASVSRECGLIEVKYLCLGRKASTADVLDEMEKKNLRPLIYEEGVALAKECPDEQRKSEIAILGSVCKDPSGESNVMVLRGNNDGRDLTARWVKNRWRSSCRFPATSKTVAKTA